MFGNDIIGKKCFEAYHKRKEPCEPHPCLALKAFQDGKVHEHDTQVIDKSGETIYFHCTANVALRDKEGNPMTVIEISRDVTDSKRAEAVLRENEEKYRALIETTDTGYLILDEAGRVIDANPEYIRLSGHQTMDEIVGRSVVEWTAPHDYERNAQEVKKCMKNGFARNLEIDYIDKDGKITPIEINAKVVNTEDGQRILSVCRDITERKQAEEVLREKEQKYRGLFDESIAAIYLYDEKKNFLDSNEAGLDLIGYSREELLCMSIPDVDADPIVVLPAHEQLLSGDRIINYEHQLKRKDGKVITVLNNSRPLTNDEGQVVGMQSTLIDITERKQAEEVLNQEKKRVETYLNIAGVMMVAIDTQGIVTMINRKGCDILGYNDRDIIGKNWFDNFVPERIASIIKPVSEQLLRGKIEPVEFFENPVLTKGGKERLIAWHNSIIKNDDGEIVGTLSSGEDITEHKKAEEALSEANNIINRSPAVAFLWKNEEGWPVEFVSENVEKLTGYSSQEFVERKISYIEIIHRDDLERVAGEVASYSKKEGLQTFKHEPYRIITKNGDVKWIDDITYIRRDPQGIITHYEGIVYDVTERKRAEEKLRESEQRLKTTLDSIQAGIVVIDAETHIIVDANPAAIRMIGAPKGYRSHMP